MRPAIPALHEGLVGLQIEIYSHILWRRAKLALLCGQPDRRSRFSLNMNISRRVFCLALLVACVYPIPAKGQADPDDPLREHFELAQHADTSGDLEKAALEYQAVLKARPELAEVRTNLGLVYYRQGKNEEAISAFREALRLKPELLAATLFLGMAMSFNSTDRSLGALPNGPGTFAISLSPKMR